MKILGRGRAEQMSRDEGEMGQEAKGEGCGWSGQKSQTLKAGLAGFQA